VYVSNEFNIKNNHFAISRLLKLLFYMFLLKTNYTPDKNTIVINSIFHADYVVFVHTYTCTVVFVHSYTLKCL